MSLIDGLTMPPAYEAVENKTNIKFTQWKLDGLVS
jgi:hypothetical protein